MRSFAYVLRRYDDYAESLRWLGEAAEHGHPGAMVSYALELEGRADLTRPSPGSGAQQILETGRPQPTLGTSWNSAETI